MSDDIATRLREQIKIKNPLYAEALDEIERLRAELVHAQSEIARLERLATNG